MSLILLQREKHTQKREVTYTSGYQGQMRGRLAKSRYPSLLPSCGREQNWSKWGTPPYNRVAFSGLQRPLALSARLSQRKLSKGCCFKPPTWHSSCKESQHRGIYSRCCPSNTAVLAAMLTANTVKSGGLQAETITSHTSTSLHREQAL